MKKVLVALSSGVDSSVAALLAKQAGYDIQAIHFIFTDKDWVNEEVNFFNNCILDHDLEIEQTKQIAKQLEIPLEVYDISREFRKYVINYFIDEYKECRTPNPCVVCNRYIKMKFLFQKMIEKNFDYIVTGHYAKTPLNLNKANKLDENFHTNPESILSRADCIQKDQSYVLAQVDNKILEKCIFPLGSFESKEKVRECAKNNNLAVFDKKESTDICFIKKGRTNEFLADNIKSRKGEIVDMKGNKLEEHKGLYNYTIGQRRGMNIRISGDNGYPRYVIKFNKKDNKIIVGGKVDLLVKKILTGEPRYINEKYKNLKNYTAMAQIRAHSSACEVLVENNEKVLVNFINNDLYGAAIGQFIVLYDKDDKDVIMSSTIEAVYS